MNSKLEELRKRLLAPLPVGAPPDTIFSSSAELSPERASGGQLTSADIGEPSDPGDSVVVEGSPPAQFPAEQVAANRDRQIAIDETMVLNQLGQAIDKLFEPTRRSSDGLADIANASDSLRQLSGSAFGLFESLKDFRDQMRKLSNSFASMRTFQNDLGVLAESFEPVRALHHEVVRLTDAVRIRLAQVARSLEPVNALRPHAAELAQILENATELQAQFYDLAKTFEPVVPRRQGPASKASVDETA